MFTTAGDVIRSAFRIIGVTAKSEVPTADEMQDALQALNLMLESWSARRLIVRGTVQFSNALTAGQYIYTMGTGGNFNTPKPIAITSGYIVDNNGISTNIDIISQEEYDSYADKFITVARPVALNFDAGLAQQAVQTGTCYLYPIPDSTPYVLVLQTQVALTDFTGITDTVTFEAKYGEAMKYELAKRLWREYHESTQPIPGDILAIGERAMCIIEKTNHVLPHASIDVPPRKTVYNVYSDDWH